MHEGKIPFNEREKDLYELALKVSGAVQAARWTKTADGGGFSYSFNGPHSLFVDAMRSLRSLAVAHQLGHVLCGERDQRISLLQRLIAHAETTALYSIHYGKGRDTFDVCGRTAHESIFNLNDGSYRCPWSLDILEGPTWAKGLRFYQAAAAWTMDWQVAGALPVAKVIGWSVSCLRNSVTKSRQEGRLAPRRHLGKGA